jgi:hypothetical protein
MPSAIDYADLFASVVVPLNDETLQPQEYWVATSTPLVLSSGSTVTFGWMIWPRWSRSFTLKVVASSDDTAYDVEVKDIVSGTVHYTASVGAPALGSITMTQVGSLPPAFGVVLGICARPAPGVTAVIAGIQVIMTP